MAALESCNINVIEPSIGEPKGLTATLIHDSSLTIILEPVPFPSLSFKHGL